MFGNNLCEVKAFWVGRNLLGELFQEGESAMPLMQKLSGFKNCYSKVEKIK
jgi:hypothetical protein